MADAMDLVRRHYRAVNAGDLEAIVALYQPDCVTEAIFLHDPTGATCRGRGEVRAGWAAMLGGWQGALDDAAFFHPRTIGGLETGWGWVHAEWVAGLAPRSGGEPRWFVGYSHFLVEDDRIRRHRSVATEATREELRTAGTRPPIVRRYPERPVVGVGAVIFVEGRVVLIRRRYEPLAGQWSLPGGTLELGETLEAGVAREVREETGLIVEVGPVLEIFDRILLDEHRKVRFHFVLIDYLCRQVGGQLVHGSDVSDVVLADPAALDVYGLTPKAADVVRQAVSLRAAR